MAQSGRIHSDELTTQELHQNLSLNEMPDSREGGEEVDPATTNVGDPAVPEEAEQFIKDSGGDEAGDSGHDGAPSSRRNFSSIWTWLKSYAFIVYTSQALSAWGDRMWAFAVGLYLVAIEENSLRLTAVYGLSVTTSVFMFGAVVGKWVDRTPRLRAIQISLFLQNSFVLLNALTMCLLLIKKEDFLDVWGGYLYTTIQLLIILLGVFSKLASVAQKIAVQKDWIVVIAGQNKESLADMNASIRRIDLTVNILAPIVVGQIMTFASMIAAGIFIASWNLVSMFVEYILLYIIYKKVPALAVKKIDSNQGEIKESPDPPQTRSYTNQLKKLNPFRAVFLWLKSTWNGLKVYRSYNIFWAALGLATIYMTVLGFDSITTGYGYALGVPEYMLGIIRALGSLAGIVGTVMFTFMRKKFGIVRSGLYCSILQITMLTLCVGSVFAPGSPFDPRFIHTRSMTTNVTGCLVTEMEVESRMSAGLFFAGMILSRIGLWSFDLVTNQQIQETVDEEHRGLFNGVQNSLQSYFDMIRFVLVIILPCPESFGYLIMVSVLAVCSGGFMYSIFSYKTRGHILPHQLKGCVSSNNSQRMRERGIA